MTEQTINGFNVRCVVTQRDGHQFRVAIAIRPASSAQSDERTWDVPGDRFFKTSDEALRYGRYVLLGISGVSDEGKPIFTVV